MGIAIGRDGEPKLCVGTLPGRKRPSLYLWHPLGIRVLASFRNEAAAETVERFIESLAGAHIVNDLGETP